MARQTGTRRDPGSQLRRAVLLAAVAACLGVAVLVTYPVLTRLLSIGRQVLPNLDRWLTVLGFLFVAVMLSALVWVVRVAADITGSAASNVPVYRDSEPERINPWPSMSRGTPGAAFAEQALMTVSRAIVGILDLNVLAQRALQAIIDAFGPERAGLFLVDSVTGTIALQAGLCRNGEAIAPQDHSVRSGHGRLGAAVVGSEPHVSSETAESLALYPGPELQGSRIEAIVPMRHQGRVIGALVLQDSEADAFGPTVIATLQDIADQLATAVEAALGYRSVQTALASARKALGQASREALLSALPEGVVGYQRLSTGDIKPIFGGGDEAPIPVAPHEKVIEQQGPILTVPIRTPDTVVGVVQLQKSDAGAEWTDHEVDLARAITDHLGEALDRVRLRDELASITARARVVREVAEHLHAAHDWDSLMRSAVEEIGHSVKASRVYVQWLPSGPDDRPNGRDQEPLVDGPDEL